MVHTGIVTHADCLTPALYSLSQTLNRAVDEKRVFREVPSIHGIRIDHLVENDTLLSEGLCDGVCFLLGEY